MPARTYSKSPIDSHSQLQPPRSVVRKFPLRLLFYSGDDKGRESGYLPRIEQSIYSRFVGIFRREIYDGKVFIESFDDLGIFQRFIFHGVAIFAP